MIVYMKKTCSATSGATQNVHMYCCYLKYCWGKSVLVKMTQTACKLCRSNELWFDAYQRALITTCIAKLFYWVLITVEQSKQADNKLHTLIKCQFCIDYQLLTSVLSGF